MEGGYLRERRTNIVDRQPGPVDADRSFIIHIVQEAGGIAGETEDGRSAQSPVGDEQGSLCADVGLGNHHLGVLHHDAHQTLQRFVADAE